MAADTVTATSGYLDDPALVARILEHVDRGSTDQGERTWREPVRNYRCPERFAAELERVLRRYPVPLCPSVAVPETGSFVERDVAGVPIFAVRGRDGVVRAFRNSCRHRGAALVSGSGCAHAFVCPFHGWTYALDGELRHVPHADGFPGIEPAARGLVELSSVEHGGLIFVDQSGDIGDVSRLCCPDDLVGPEQALLGTSRIVLDANWKVLVEGFLEGYHIKATHRETFFPLGYDNLTVLEQWGRNNRVTFPFRRVEALRAVPAAERRVGKAAAVIYHLFPNVIVARLSHHISLAVLEPLAVDRTALVTYSLGKGGGGSNGGGDARRDADFIEAGIVEDRAVALAVQRGLSAGANEFLEFGRSESALAHFHHQLGALIAG